MKTSILIQNVWDFFVCKELVYDYTSLRPI